MIDVTVKTLDSQNHRFSVPDDITVKQFKERIASSVNIQADKQRLIYCGRVLQDDKKLADYNVHEKVVHLVMRAPPQTSSRAPGGGASATSNGATGGAHHHHHHIRRQPGIEVTPTQGPSSSGVRLHQARTMLERAANVLDQMDRRLGTGSERTPSTESTSDNDQASSPIQADDTRGERGAMETDAAEDTRPTSNETVADEGAAAASSTATTPPSDEMEALYSEMDALNNMDPTTMVPASVTPPMMGAINGSLAGGLAQAASAAVASALSSLARGGPGSSMAGTSSTGTTGTSSTSTTSATETSTNSTTSTTSSAPTASSTSSSSSGPTSSTGSSVGAPPDVRPTGSEGNRQSAPSTSTSNANTSTSTTENTSSAATASTSEGANNNESGLGNVQLEHPRCSVMVEILDLYNQIHRRLEPYMTRYHQTMANDTAFGDGDAASLQQEQWLLWRVSEVLHFVSHAMHAISDIMVDLRRPPPRQLRARPIIIQQPALVQAQINVTTSTDPTRVTISSRGGNRPNSTTVTSSSSNTTSTSASQSTSTSTSSRSAFGTAHGEGQTAVNANQTSSPATTTSSTPSAPSAASSSSSATPSSQAVSQARNLASMLNLGAMQGFPMDGGDLVLMEVGPHGITIDSLSAEGSGNTGGSAPTPELIRNLVSSITNQLGALSGGAASTSSTSSSSSVANPASSATTSNVSSSTPSSGPGVQRTPPARNSQAAGNSGTSTTNVTQTRVTPRPHVHVTPLNVPGMGMNQFDPFLPCQSHHIRPATRRRHQAQTQTQVGGSQAQQRRAASSSRTQESGSGDNSQIRPQVGISPTAPSSDPLAFFASLMAEAFGARQGSGIPHHYHHHHQPQPQQQQSQSAAVDSSEPQISDQMFAQLVQGVMNQVSGSLNAEGGSGSQSRATLHEFLQPFDGGMFSERDEDSLFYQLLNTVAMSISIGDLVQLFFGRATAANQLRAPLQEFVRERALKGNQPTEENLDRAIDSVIHDLHPHLVLTAGDAHVHEGIDYVNTVHNFIRHRLHDIFNLVLNHTDAETFGPSLVSLVRRGLWEFIALSLHCFTDGAQGLERVIQERVRSIMAGVSPAIQTWSINTSIMQLRSMMSRMTITDDHIRRYVVSPDEGRRMEEERSRRLRDTESPASQSTPLTHRNTQQSSAADNMVHVTPANVPAEEPMEVEEVGGIEEVITTGVEAELEIATEGATGGTPEPKEDDSLTEEPPVTINMGSQSWHSAVPQDWIPVITRDVERQQRGVPDSSLSDAYLCGMPLKRRKLASQHKPHGTVQQVIQDTLRHSMRGVGVNRVVVESVAGEAASQLRESFADHVRTSLRERLNRNKDFKPEKFPKSEQHILKDK